MEPWYNNTTRYFRQEDLNPVSIQLGCISKLVDFDSPEEIKYILEERNESRFKICYIISCVVLAVFNIVSNTCYIHGLRKTNRKLSHVQKLLVYLSATDLLGGCCVLPLFIIGKIYGSQCIYRAIVLSLNYSVAFNNATITLVISALRYKAIHRPTNKSRGKNIFKMVAIEFALSCIVFCSVAYVHYYGMNKLSSRIMVSASFIIFSALNGAILVFLLLSLITIRRKAKDSELSMNIKRRLKRQKKSANTLLIIIIFSFICMFVQSGSLAFLYVQTKNVTGVTLLKLRTLDIASVLESHR